MADTDSNKNSSKDNPFVTKQPTSMLSSGNPFKIKVLNEDASEGIKREFFGRKHELSEKEPNKKNNKE
jgi:hypothetical protein